MAMTTPMNETVREPRSQMLARRIRGVIAEMQVQQLDLVATLGMSQPNLSRKVNGRVPFTPDEVQGLAAALEVSEAYLYGFTNDRSLSATPG